MTMEIRTQALVVRCSDNARDIAAVQEFRMQGFPGAASGNDPFDKKCEHILVECRASAQLLGCVRVFQMASGTSLTDCYSQQFYELARLNAYPNPILELGRFCVAPVHIPPM